MIPNNKYDISGSIVLFKNDLKTLELVVKSFLDTDLNVKLYLIDNSPTDELKYFYAENDRVEYIFNNENSGFGKAHNQILLKAPDISHYHLVLNPDVYFDGSILKEIFLFMEKEKSVGQLMPKILYPDGSIQYLCKPLPRPIDLISRFIIPFDTESKRNFELRFYDYNRTANIPYLSGCFMFLRTSVIKEVGGFDENIFMYLEDGDLSRRIHMKYQTLFYPNAVAIHEHNKESFRNLKLLLIHMKSVIYYFNKYGWFFDKERKKINKQVLRELNQLK
ncbi:MAG: GT2 family glycosyltransferase [Psychroserpens sp.]|jgi:GT2 family glycosyltransferase